MAVYTAVDDAGIFFNTVLYAGTGSSNAVTGAGFQPDFTWIKNRDAADFHVLTDAVRLATNYLVGNETAAEVTNVESLKSFDSDGFTVGTMNEVNTVSENFVSWNWKAGTTTGIAGSPSITPSSYSLNATSGFSVIGYTGNGTSGATVPHGLGVAPRMILVKRRDAVGSWLFYRAASGNTAYIQLSTADPTGNSTAMWNDTSPTTTLFSLGNNGSTNADTGTFVAYCFADIQGYSRVSSYTGNANVNGPFVYTGFRPAFVLVKRTVGIDSWYLLDNKRVGYNSANYPLSPDTTAAAATSTIVADILSNGFKIRASSTSYNGSTELILYAAFAESPFVNSEGVPVNAR